MTPQEYARATGQHEQRRQQAALFVVPQPPTRIDAYLGCVHPEDEDWLRDTIEATFAHADRVEIETWSFPVEEIEPDLSAADLAYEHQLRAAEFADTES